MLVRWACCSGIVTDDACFVFLTFLPILPALSRWLLYRQLSLRSEQKHHATLRRSYAGICLYFRVAISLCRPDGCRGMRIMLLYSHTCSLYNWQVLIDETKKTLSWQQSRLQLLRYSQYILAFSRSTQARGDQG